jgi:hypothetical protein
MRNILLSALLGTCLICASLLGLSVCAQTTQAVPRPPQAAHRAEARAAVQSASSAKKVSAAQVKELMELTGMGEIQKEAIDQMMPALRQALPPYVPGDVFQDFENRMLGPELQVTIIRAYQAHLSAQDAMAAIAFYRSEAGRHVLAATPQITHDVQVGVQEFAQKEMLEIVKMHQAEINAAKMKYQAAHPSSPPTN